MSCNSEADACRSVRIAGKAMFTMKKSRKDRKEPAIRTGSISHRRLSNGRSGRGEDIVGMDTEVVGGGVRRRTPPFGSYETTFRRISSMLCLLFIRRWAHAARRRYS